MSIYAKIRDGKDSATEADLTTIQSDFLSDDGGIVDVSGGDCEVTEKGTPDMSVDVAAGSGYIPLAAWSQNSREQKIGPFNNTATVNVSISSNASGNDRIDIVCAKWDTGASPDANGSNVVTFAVTEGTPAASPAVPATPNNQYKLAEVLVSNGTASITNSDITDSRAACTPSLYNNTGYHQKDSGGTNRELLNLGSDDVLHIGPLKRQDIAVDSDVYANSIQTGWSFVTGDGINDQTPSIDITYDEAFDVAPIVLVSGCGYKDGSDPTDITDLSRWEVMNFTCLSESGSLFSVKGITADGTVIGNTRRVAFTWIAIGQLA